MGIEPVTWVISEKFFNTFSHLNTSSHVKTFPDFILNDDFEDRYILNELGPPHYQINVFFASCVIL